jgi:tRNA nucleotidyltransferase (CCA-adding enzyme)
VTFNIDIPAGARAIIQVLQNNGHSAYVVGGCVRDSLLCRKPKDWDICTSALPEEMMTIFANYRLIETGLKHGTLTVVIDCEPYEVTTFRVDGEYSDNRRPDYVTFTDKLEEDLSRRDFTINAMAYNDIEGLIDPFSGVADLRNCVIRCVGVAEERFGEDALRVLRALRFACQLGFSIDSVTGVAAIAAAPLLKNISKERVNSELCKMVTTKHFADIMRLYPAILGQIMPEVCDMVGFAQNNPYHEFDVWTHTIAALSHDNSADLTTRLAIFFHDFGKPHCYQDAEDGVRHFKGHGKVSAEIADDIMCRLRFDNKTRHDVTELVHYHDATFEVGTKYIKRWLHKIGPEQFKRLLAIRRADIEGQSSLHSEERLSKVDTIERLLETVLENSECFSIKDLAVSGTDLLQLGYKSDKKLGQTLTELLQLVIDGEILNKKDELIKVALDKLQGDGLIGSC